MAVAMAFAVIMVVMALGVRVILQGSTDKRLNLLVGVPVYTGVQCDASAGQRLSSATANPTAQQDGYAVVFQKSSESAVPASAGVQNLTRLQG